MRLGEIIDDNHITFLSSVPSVWRLALRTARPPSQGSLQRVFCGSAPLSADLWRQIQKWSGAEVCNVYGITETSSWIGGTTVPKIEPQDGFIGVPWGSEIKIMRGGGAEAAPGLGVEAKSGEEGDVWVKTPALMRGYLDRDDLTRQVVSAGWFSTGDIGLVDDNGMLSLRGRKRDEINKGGMKIYPSDIDQVAERFPAVIDLCCFAYEDSYYGQNIGIGLVLNEKGDAPVRELHCWMRKHLAEHKMPVRWYLLEQIPRTSRGKVNRLEVAHHCASLEPLDLRRALMGES